MAIRLKGRCGYPKDDPFRVTYHEDRILDPFGWTKPLRIFVCSMSDLFHPLVKYDWVAVFETIRRNERHRFLVLTKRPERMRAYLSTMPHLPSNAWPGVTAENQARADERIPILLDIPAAKHFVSVEPMLERVDLAEFLPGDKWFASEHFMSYPLDWVICGGETGPAARPIHPDWARSLRDQCQEANVFFLQKLGEYVVPKTGRGAVESADARRTTPVTKGVGGSKRISALRVLERRLRKEIARLSIGWSGKRALGELDGRTWDEEPSVVEEAVK